MRCVSLINVYLVQTHHKCEMIGSHSGSTNNWCETIWRNTSIAEAKFEQALWSGGGWEEIEREWESRKKRLTENRFENGINAQQNIPNQMWIVCRTQKVHKLMANYLFTLLLQAVATGAYIYIFICTSLQIAQHICIHYMQFVCIHRNESQLSTTMAHKFTTLHLLKSNCNG